MSACRYSCATTSSGRARGFESTAQERDDLSAFLEALTDDAFLTDPRFGDPDR